MQFGGATGAEIEHMEPGSRSLPPPPKVVAPSPAVDGATRAPAILKHRRGWRPGLLLFGLILVVGSMLAGILLFDSVTTTTRVLVAAEDLNRGQILTTSDVRVAEITVTPEINVLPLDEQRFLGGESAGEPVRVLRGFVPAGSVLTKEHFVEQGELVGANEALVGARLETGRYPSTLRVGDEVEMFAASPRNTGEGAAYIGRAEVWNVWQAASEEDRTDDLIADLLIDADFEAAVLQAQSEGNLLLTLVSDGRG
jgi:hypothetical protein